LGLEATTVPGSRGAFDVIVDGRKIFSKHAEHRFPEHGEIIATLKSLG
jgi:selT/selW/selH-like putative selenoprotein